MLLLSLGNPVFHTALHGMPLCLFRAEEKHKEEYELIHDGLSGGL